jgi:hypothetical protein
LAKVVRFLSGSRPGPARGKPQQQRRRLLLEPLEDRCVPTTITPTTFADGVLGSGSLRDAVLQFNADTGTGDDTIQLLAGTYTLTIRNTHGHDSAGLEGDLDLTQTSHHWIIQGAGSSTIIDASQLQDREFQIVNPGTQAVFRNLVIQGGLAQDNGTDGALPGTTDALGGGILNNGGNVTLDNVVLTNNVARGGNGADGAPGQAGGNGRNALGGGAYSTGGSLTISGSTFASDQAIGGHGGRGGDGFTTRVNTFPAGAGGTGGASQGGGLYATGGSLSISESTLANNQAAGGNGGFGGTGIQGSGFTPGGGGTGGTGGAAQGAGFFASGAMISLTNSTLSSNAVHGGDGGNGGRGFGDGANGGAGQGGGVYDSGSMLTLTNATVAMNTVRGGDGGNAGGCCGFGGIGGVGQGAGLFTSGAMISLTNSTLSTNTVRGGNGGNAGYSLGIGGNGGAGQGGGAYVSSSVLTLTNATVATNTVGGGNGGNSGPYGWISFSPTGGPGGAGQGGGLFSSGTVTVANSTLSTNTVRGGDGGTGANDFNGLSGGPGGAGQGGALFSSGTVTLTNSTLSANTVRGGNGGNGYGGYGGYNGGPGGAGQGGALFNSGTATVTNSTLSTNSVRGGNGGNGGNGSRVRGGNGGNGAGGLGGGIYVGARTCALTDVTVAFNTAEASLGGAGGTGSPPGSPGTGGPGQGGGLGNAGGSVNALNTLIGDNSATSAPDFSGAVASLGHNLISNSSGGSGYTGTDLLDVDPLLGPLQDYGGPTLTHALLPGSPALNSGNPNQLGLADQRGVVRRGGVNIGAYQASASAFVLTVPGTATAGTAFNVTVKAVDPFGQTAVGYTATVHFTSSDGQAVLPGDYPFTSADAGMHTFSGAVTLKTAGNQTITARDTATSSITGSASVTVTPAAAHHLLFLQQPTDTAAGQTISPVIVEVVDQFGNVETSDNSDTITLSIGVNPSGGTLSGTLTLTVVNGVATLSDLSIDLAGMGYTLHATSGSLTAADSTAFNVM